MSSCACSLAAAASAKAFLIFKAVLYEVSLEMMPYGGNGVISKNLPQKLLFFPVASKDCFIYFLEPHVALHRSGCFVVGVAPLGHKVLSPHRLMIVRMFL